MRGLLLFGAGGQAGPAPGPPRRRRTGDTGGHISTEPRINERIRVPEVRLVGPAGEQIGIVAINDALRLAQESDLDLVEVAPTARPPVCKLMDYGKFKYESALKARESRKNQAQTVIKEIKLRPKIDPHDYGTKRGHVERFLKAGDKVKVTIMFRGREQSRPELGFKLLQRLAGDVDELGFVEAQPKQDGRNMIMVIGPHKRKADAKPTDAPVDPKTEHSAAVARAERVEARAAALSAQSEAVAAAPPVEPATPAFPLRATPPPDSQAPAASARPASSRPSGSGYAGSSSRPSGSGYAGSSPRPAGSGAAGGAPRTPAPSAGSRPTGAPRPSAPRPAGPPRPAGTSSPVPGSSGPAGESGPDRPAAASGPSTSGSGSGSSGPASSGPAAPRPAAPRPAPRPGAPRPAPPRPAPPRPAPPRPRPVSPVPAQRADTGEEAAKPDPAE
ncbi:MAG TPA: translation initiation factor IF-3 [Streptosporangiaceae bacterium]